jgi:hypothetical protein
MKIGPYDVDARTGRLKMLLMALSAPAAAYLIGWTFNAAVTPPRRAFAFAGGVHQLRLLNGFVVLTLAAFAVSVLWFTGWVFLRVRRRSDA